MNRTHYKQTKTGRGPSGQVAGGSNATYARNFAAGITMRNGGEYKGVGYVMAYAGRFAFRGLLCAIFSIRILGFARAEDAVAVQVPQGGEGSFLIAAVEYTGSFKTSKDWLVAVIGLHPGIVTTNKELERAEQRLYDTGLYSVVKISTEDEVGGKRVVVDLKEKWTLVPIPIASSSGGNHFGLFVIDSDFLGSGNIFYAGAIGGVERMTGNLGFLYRDPSSPGDGVDIKASGGYRKITESKANGSSYIDYGLRSGNLSTRIAFSRGLPLHLSALSEFQWADPQGDNARSMDSEYFIYLPGIGIGYEELRGKGWFKEGVSISTDYKVGLSFSGAEPYHVLESHGNYSLSLFDRDDLIVGGSLLYGDAPQPLRFELHGNGFRTLPSGTSFSSQAASAFLQYESPVISLKWAVLTTCAFYEVGSYRMGADSDAPWHSFTGPGLGVRFYLKNVAVPALGLDYAYNQLEKNSIFNITLGFSK